MAIDNSLLPTGLFRIVIGDGSDELQRLLSKNAVAVGFPGISSAELPAPFRNKQGFTPSDAISYETLSVTFAVDEQLRVYQKLHDWIVANTTDDNLDVHDIAVEFITSHYNVSRTCRFHNAFPTAVGGVELNVQQETTDYAFIEATFAYDRFVFDDV